MHNAYVRPLGQWFYEHVPCAADLRALDLYQSQSINGDAGDAVGWSPLTPIIIGGQGIKTTSSGTSLQGGLLTYRGGRLQHGDTDYITLSPSRSRTITFAIADARFKDANAYKISRSIDPVGLLSAAAWGGDTLEVPILKRFLHNGARLTSVSLTMRVGIPHLGLPGTQPGFTLYRLAGNRSANTNLGSVALAAGTADAYYAAGAVQTITLSGLTEVIDTTANEYEILLADENGANSLDPPLNVFHAFTLTYDTISDMRPE